MKLYRTGGRMVVEEKGEYYPVEKSLDALVALDDLYLRLESVVGSGAPLAPGEPLVFAAPIEHQEVWAAGVTY